MGREGLKVVPFSLCIPILGWLWQHRLYTMPLSKAWALAFLIVGQDFSYYWMHRASHRIRWFWTSHVPHHSSNQLNFATAIRLGWTMDPSGQTLFYAPLVCLGFSPQTVITAAGVALAYQLWIHTTWIPKLGWLEKILNTPSHHRVHHAINPEYLDRNYGGIFIIFDRLFGTMAVERPDVPCRYGIIMPLNSYNPVKIALHEWAALGRDLFRAGSWRERLSYLVGLPGWRPNGLSTTSDDLRRAALAEARSGA